MFVLFVVLPRRTLITFCSFLNGAIGLAMVVGFVSTAPRGFYLSYFNYCFSHGV